MNDREPGVAYIKNERVELTREPPERKPPEHEVMNDAIDILQAQRRGEDVRNYDKPRGAEDDALETLKYERQEAEQRPHKEAEREREAQREQSENEIRQAQQWNTGDAQTLQTLGQWDQINEEDKKQFVHEQRWAQANPDKVTAEDRQYLAQKAKDLKAQNDYMTEQKQRVQKAGQHKSLKSEQARLFRDVPELRDESNRERLISWAESKGIPRDQALAEQRRSVIAQAWKEMNAEERESAEKHRNRPRKPVQRRPGLPSELTVEQARKELKSGGTMGDAMNLLTLSRERDNEAQS